VFHTHFSHTDKSTFYLLTYLLTYSVHAEKLPNDVLQSVVDLLWNQLNAMTALIVSTDDVILLDEAQLQRKQLR